MLTGAYVKGQQREAVITALRFFPGYPALSYKIDKWLKN